MSAASQLSSANKTSGSSASSSVSVKCLFIWPMYNLQSLHSTLYIPLFNVSSLLQYIYIQYLYIAFGCFVCYFNIVLIKKALKCAVFIILYFLFGLLCFYYKHLLQQFGILHFFNLMYNTTIIELNNIQKAAAMNSNYQDVCLPEEQLCQAIEVTSLKRAMTLNVSLLQLFFYFQELNK